MTTPEFPPLGGFPDFDPSMIRNPAVRNTLIATGGAALGAGAVVASLLYADARHAARRWASREVQIGLADSSQEKVPEAWIVLPGMGVKTGKEIARDVLQPVSSPRGIEAAYLRFCDGQPSIETIARAINKFADRHVETNQGEKVISIVGHSMGGVVDKQVRPLLADGIRVDKRLYISSPFTHHDVLQPQEKLATLLVGRMGPHIGGTVIKSIMTFGRQRFNRAGLPNDFKACWDKVVEQRDPETASPRLWVGQMNILGTTSSRYRRIPMSGDGKVGYAMPFPFTGDHVVKVCQAYANYSMDHGRWIDPLLIPDVEHARPTDEPAKYQEAIAGWLDRPPRPVHELPDELPLILEGLKR